MRHSLPKPGLLLRRALEIRAALKLGIRISLNEIRGDEFYALVVVDEEHDLVQREKMPLATVP